MVVSRWQLPAAPLRASAALSQLAGLVAVVGLAMAARASLPLGALYPLKAAIIFGGVMLVAIGFLAAGHPFARFGPANQTTTVRAILMALVVGLIGEPRPPLVAATAAGTTLVIAGLDGLDGWLARRTRMASAFGARFDMETDALLVMALSILAWQFGKAGAWVVLSGLMRYAFVAASWCLPWMRRPLFPSVRRKAVCVVQIVGLTLVMLPLVAPPASAWLAGIALAALSWSFLVDVAWLWRNAEAH
jgi:phosphatidylglycerophosphate synthase